MLHQINQINYVKDMNILLGNCNENYYLTTGLR